jgi:ATP-dependent DNA helicase DinG
VCRIVAKLCDDNGGRSLVLLSSMRLLRSVAGFMRERERGYDVLAQGDLPQRELLRRFREVETSVLLGSVSFREGVDVPGDGLTQVIIDRIPFPHPNDPLVQARNVLEGQKAFIKTTLPNAKMFLRQAVGRLIRSGSDQGRVTLLDGRVLDREDWRVLETLPRCPCRRLAVKI